MSEDKTTGTAVAVRPPPATSEVAVWDTASFEHMKRVAVVLSQSGLVPETISHGEWQDETGKAMKGYLGDAIVGARCTLICNQARLWGADPLNVLQCTSLINGRLMYEGKLIAAVVASMTGVKLRYKLGLWDTDHITFAPTIQAVDDRGEGVFDADGAPVMVADPAFLYGAGERLAVRCYDPDDVERHVDGSVAQWKTTRSGNPWSSPSAWTRQLRYRASREWARAYEPGVILGILADGDQDIEEITQTVRPVGLMQRLSGEQSGDGFHAQQVEDQTGPKPKRRTKAEKLAEEALAAAEAGVEPEEGMHAAEPVQESAEIEHVAEDVLVSEPEVDTSEHASPGETYLMGGDAYNGDNRRMTYRDGLRYSTVHRDSEAKFHEYGVHAPTPEILQSDDGIPEHMRDDLAPSSVEASISELVEGVEPYREGDVMPEGVLDRPTETGSAPPAEPEPATSALAGPVLTDGPETSGSGQSAQPEGPTEPEAVPEDTAEFPADFQGFIDLVESATTWDQTKSAMRDFYNTETFKGMDATRQNKVRANTAIICMERRDEGLLKGLPDQIEDLSFFRLWLEAQFEVDVISGTRDLLYKSNQWAQASDVMKGAINKAVAARIEAVR